MTVAARPRTLGEALDLMHARPGRVRPVAGCTDLLVVDHASGRRHEAVLDLTALPELAGIRSEPGFLDVGATCTFASLRAHPIVRERFPILAEVAGTIGGWQIQTRATLGGNIVNASPAGDSLPVLLALDARLVLASAEGRRELPYEQMHVGYRETALRPDELLERVRIPFPAPGTLQLFRKIGTREAQAISKVVLAMAARRAGNSLHDVRIAAGSVAPTPIRLRAAESLCEGRPVSRELADRAAHAAADAVQPIDDVRSTAAYRSFALARALRRMILRSAE